jgi:hypothetical protein
MGSQLLEWCADIFGATKRSRWLPFLLALYASLLCSFLLGARWGLWEALMPIAVVLVLAPYVARRVIKGREELWRAASLPLGSAGQRPDGRGEWLKPPTAVAIGRLAAAVDRARRGEPKEASKIMAVIAQDLLREDEARLLEATRAMISLRSGDERRAAQQAVLALPSGSELMDEELGRAVVSDAWSDAKRLCAIDAAWEEAGVGLDQESALSRLRALVKLRARGGDVSALGPAEARVVAEEARAIGDEELAAELEVHGRGGAYR